MRRRCRTARATRATRPTCSRARCPTARPTPTRYRIPKGTEHFWARGRASGRFVAAMQGLIDSRIQTHDSRQFEVKLDYSIDPTAKQNHYQVDAYFFIPKSLGINSQTYS